MPSLFPYHYKTQIGECELCSLELWSLIDWVLCPDHGEASTQDGISLALNKAHYRCLRSSKLSFISSYKLVTYPYNKYTILNSAK